MSRKSCECDTPNIDHDAANGIAFCTNCGTVLEENAIVAEVQFVEGGDGRHMALGSRVSATGRNSGHPYGRSSMDSSAMVARQTILQFATALNCNVDNVVEIAHRIYTVTHSQGLTKGRQVARVCAVCLYIALRKERTPVMLIEFADLLKVSVFKLGTLFMLIRRHFPDDADILDIDPSIYIARFAAMLHFGAKTKDVVNDAMKLVRRMQRDWLADGRRPAGICGACLLIAARMHNFKRSVQDIVQIVKMSGVTVKTRLKEFKKTSAANLSTTEFRIQYDSNNVDTPGPPSALDTTKVRKRALTSISLVENQEKDPCSPPKKKQAFITEETTKATPMVQEPVPLNKGSNHATPSKDNVAAATSLLTPPSTSNHDVDDTSLSDLDNDDEIINMLVTPEEASLRASIWHGLNRDYLIEQKQREARKSQSKPRPHKPKEPPPTSMMEAVHRLAVKKISTKINQAMLSQLFQSPSSANGTISSSLSENDLSVAPAAEEGAHPNQLPFHSNKPLHPNEVPYATPSKEWERRNEDGEEEEYEQEEEEEEEEELGIGFRRIPSLYDFDEDGFEEY